jgi:hypothetical protein
LTVVERAIRNKAYFTTRAGKHFDRPALGVSGAPLYSSLYEKYPFLSDSDLLDAYNVMLITAFREVNVGTMDAFDFDYDAEFNVGWLKAQLPRTLARCAKALRRVGSARPFWR